MGLHLCYGSVVLKLSKDGDLQSVQLNVISINPFSVSASPHVSVLSELLSLRAILSGGEQLRRDCTVQVLRWPQIWQTVRHSRLLAALAKVCHVELCKCWIVMTDFLVVYQLPSVQRQQISVRNQSSLSLVSLKPDWTCVTIPLHNKLCVIVFSIFFPNPWLWSL